MPSRGTKTVQLYSEALDVIREIIIKYRQSHTIILGGDSNASALQRDPTNNIDRIFRAFNSDLGITTPKNYPEIPTFYHHDNKSKSQIDYLLNVESQANAGINSIKIMEHQSLNTSDHVLNTGIINII
jgi:hypothetical protein